MGLWAKDCVGPIWRYVRKRSPVSCWKHSAYLRRGDGVPRGTLLSGSGLLQIDALRGAIDDALRRLSPNSAMAKALAYATARTS